MLLKGSGVVEEARKSALEQLTERPQVSGKSKMQTLLTALIIFVIIGIGYVLYSNGVFADKGYKKPIEAYFEAICERDFDAYVGCMPEMLANDYVVEREAFGYSKYDYLNELYSDVFSAFGDDVEVRIKYLGTERPDEAIIEEFASSYKKAYGSTINTKTIYKVVVDASFAGSNGAETIKMDCYTIKLNGKWYIAGCDFASAE